jgi:2-desacetyl-2-hydroxyethyl bacteriochlorophyllide A dehydrogenase
LSTRHMKALVYEGPQIMNMRTLPFPIPAKNEVLLKVEKVGICGSELSGYLGKNSLRLPPLVMGHEFSGMIEEIGEDVVHLKRGDRATANPLISCGNCFECLSGIANLCHGRKLIGAHQPGAFAEYVAVPAASIHLLPDHMSMELAAMTEPFACAVHICRLVNMSPVDRLFIAGAGPIGLFVLQAAKVFGVSNIVVLDINKERLEIAKEMGAQTVSSPEELKALVLDGGFNVAVDAVGMDVTRQQCIEFVRPGGRVVFSGLHSADSRIPANLLVRNEVKIFGAFSYNPADFSIALEWLSENKANLLPWTIDEPIENGQDCFELLLNNPGKVAKILLHL